MGKGIDLFGKKKGFGWGNKGLGKYATSRIFQFSLNMENEEYFEYV